MQEQHVDQIGRLMVGSNKIHRMQLRFLMKGHSHEDIDQWFSAISGQIESHPQLHTPEEFLEMLTAYCLPGKE